MTRFVIFSGRSTLLELPLGKSRGVPCFEVQETARIGFEVDDYDEGVTYEITVGDIPLSEEPQHRRSRLEWAASACLDGASGVTPISLRDATSGAILARSLALVTPSKLSSAAYDAMFDDMRRISVELLLDLISKSRLTLARRMLPQHGGVQPLTARLELGQIRRFWKGFSLIVAEILEDPHIELQNRKAVRRPTSGERLSPKVVQQFLNRGLSVREAIRTGELVELSKVAPGKNTYENRAIVAFIDLLRRRVDRSLRRARAERDSRVARVRDAGLDDRAISRFISRREEPKIAKLQEVVEACEEIMLEMRRAIRSFAVPVTRMGRQEFLNCFDRPVFRSHSKYSRVSRFMRMFLNNYSIVVEQGDAEGAKSIETIFEQWVFFQVSAALQAAGLRCISHNSVFEPIARDRFSVDLDRNAALDFETADNRLVRIRYEPTILPRHAARGIDSIFRGHSASPWTPDIVIEVLVPGSDPRDYRLAYAAVIDAKYTTAGSVWGRLQEIEKYREIRSVETDSQIARQVWVAAPIAASLQPRDEAVTWSSSGDVGANPLDVILGIIGVDPGDRDQTGSTLKAFILGLLEHSREYTRITKSSQQAIEASP